MRTACLILGVLLSGAAWAEIYQSVDDSGAVVFSDRPMGADAATVELQQPSVYTPREIPSSLNASSAAGEEQASAFEYERIEILSPRQDETIRDNTGRVPIAVAVAPGLRSGDSLTLVMNGEVLVEGLKTLSLPLSNVDRGTHELVAVVKDADGNRIGSSAAVSFHVHRAALGNKVRPPVPR